MKNTRIFILLMLAECVLLYGTLTNGHVWGDDFAAYIMQAKSIVEGAINEFIAANRFTIEHSSYAIGPIVYPWGFPGLLAPFYKFFGLNFIVLKVVGCLAYLLFLVLLWFGFRRDHKPSWRLCLFGLFALNPTLLAFSNMIASDLPFLFFSTLSLILIKTLVIEKTIIFSRHWDSIILGTVITLAFLLRSNGILLLATLGFSQLASAFFLPKPLEPNKGHSQTTGLASVNRGKRNPVFTHILPYITFFFLLVMWELVFPKGGASHASALKNISLSVIKGQLYYYAVLPATFFIGTPYYRLFYLASIPLAILGARHRSRSDYHAILYTTLTLLLYIVWPGTQGIRFLFPILPFYLSFMLSGLEILQNKAKQPLKPLYYLPVMFVIISFSVLSLQNINDNIHLDRATSVGPVTGSAGHLFAFINEHTEAESTIIFVKPRLMRLMTDRNAIMVNKAEELSRGDYLCLYRQTNDYDDDQVPLTVIEALQKEGVAQEIYENNDFKVYRLKKTV